MPLSHKQGSTRLSVVAVCTYFCVSATCSLLRLQFSGQVQKVCKESSGALPHLVHKVLICGLQIAIRVKGQVAPDIIVSKAHLKGYCSEDLWALTILRVASQSIPRSIPFPLKWCLALSRSSLIKKMLHVF